MKRTFLREFEEIVLLTVASLNENSYAVTMTQELETKTDRQVEMLSNECGLLPETPSRNHILKPILSASS